MTRCTHTGLTIPECSCRACLLALVETQRHGRRRTWNSRRRRTRTRARTPTDGAPPSSATLSRHAELGPLHVDAVQARLRRPAPAGLTHAQRSGSKTSPHAERRDGARRTAHEPSGPTLTGAGCPSQPRGSGRRRERVVERDRDEQVEEVGDPARVAPGALLDPAQAVLRGVRMDLQALGREAQVAGRRRRTRGSSPSARGRARGPRRGTCAPRDRPAGARCRRRAGRDSRRPSSAPAPRPRPPRRSATQRRARLLVGARELGHAGGHRADAHRQRQALAAQRVVHGLEARVAQRRIGAAPGRTGTATTCPWRTTTSVPAVLVGRPGDRRARGADGLLDLRGIDGRSRRRRPAARGPTARSGAPAGDERAALGQPTVEQLLEQIAAVAIGVGELVLGNST